MQRPSGRSNTATLPSNFCEDAWFFTAADAVKTKWFSAERKCTWTWNNGLKFAEGCCEKASANDRSCGRPIASKCPFAHHNRFSSITPDRTRLNGSPDRNISQGNTSVDSSIHRICPGSVLAGDSIHCNRLNSTLAGDSPHPTLSGSSDNSLRQTRPSR